MIGGDREVVGNLCFRAKDTDSRESVELRFPVAFYEASILVDAIVSYAWLAEHGICINPRRHGLMCWGTQGMQWVSGEKPKGMGSHVPKSVAFPCHMVQGLGSSDIPVDIGSKGFALVGEGKRS